MAGDREQDGRFWAHLGRDEAMPAPLDGMLSDESTTCSLLELGLCY